MHEKVKLLSCFWNDFLGPAQDSPGYRLGQCPQPGAHPTCPVCRGAAAFGRVRPGINKAATHPGLKCKRPSVLVGCELCINLAPYVRRQAHEFMCSQAESWGFFAHTDLSTVDRILYFLFKQILIHSKEGIPGANT